MVSLMNVNSELRDLILGYFHIKCPYLLPYYPAKQLDQSAEDYFGSLGYRVTGWKVVFGSDLKLLISRVLTFYFISCCWIFKEYT